MESSKFCKK